MAPYLVYGMVSSGVQSRSPHQMAVVWIVDLVDSTAIVRGDMGSVYRDYVLGPT